MEFPDQVPYDTAKDFDRALTDRIASAALVLPYGVAQLRRQFAYGGLLARLFLHWSKSQPVHLL
jgi:hypothetical protein